MLAYADQLLLSILFLQVIEGLFCSMPLTSGACMQVLLKLNLADTRQFFAAFFDLSDHHWQGFLSARLTFPQLIGFGLALFLNSSNRARANLLAKGTPGLIGVAFSLIKTAGR